MSKVPFFKYKMIVRDKIGSAPLGVIVRRLEVNGGDFGEGAKEIFSAID